MNAEARQRFDALQAAHDKAKDDLAKTYAELAAAQKALAEIESAQARFDARVVLEVQATRFLGDAFTGRGKTDREVMLEVLSVSRPDFNPTNRSDDYVRAVFDQATSAQPIN